MVELLGQKSAETSWSSGSWHYFFVFMIMQMEEQQRTNHILCCHNGPAWKEERGDLLELALLVSVHDFANDKETEGESHLAAAIMDLLGHSARTSWSSRS